MFDTYVICPLVEWTETTYINNIYILSESTQKVLLPLYHMHIISFRDISQNVLLDNRINGGKDLNTLYVVLNVLQKMLA